NFQLSWTDQYDQLLKDLEPLANQGRVIYVPLPKFGFRHPSRKVVLNVLRSACWLKPLNPPVLDGDVRLEAAKKPDLLNVQIPFLQNAPLHVLAKVIADEEGRLAEFRVKLRKTVAEAIKLEQEGLGSHPTLVRDMLEAEVNQLERVLEKYSRM